MVACLSSSWSPDALPRNFNHHHRQRFAYGDALTSLQNCTHFKHLKQTHARIIRNGLSHDPSLLTKLIRLYSSLGKMDYSTLIFHHHHESIPGPPLPTFAWNLMIRSYTLNNNSRQALLLYNLMICRGGDVSPDKFTFPFVIKACLAFSELEKGKEVHALAIKCVFSKDIFVQNTLMDLYFKCGDSDYARTVFDKMRVRSIVSWTTMVAGLVSCGELDVARVVFERMPIKNVVSWTVMINGYARKGRSNEAFELFWRMQIENVIPNEFTLVSLLIACAELGSLNLGRWIHEFALKNGFAVGVFLGTALIDMYSKCGSLEDAKRVFESMEAKSTATWNSMITGLGVHGRGGEALDLFAKMERENVQPDAITFVGVLCACVRAHNVAEGRRYFKYMSERYGITPNAEHHACMVELCSHGCDDNMLDDVCKLLEAVPS